MRQPLTIILLGDIAAGKDTQAKILAKKFHLRLVETGAYSRKIWAQPRMRRVKQGKLAPSDIIQKFLKTKILRIKSRDGLLVNGGKMPAEARLIYRLLEAQNRKILVIYLKIPERETLKRLRSRRVAEKRFDDDPRALANRIAYYKKIYRKTVKFWKSKGLLKTVDGHQSIGKVTTDIIKTIKQWGF